jgi:hypothetical protein
VKLTDAEMLGDVSRCPSRHSSLAPAMTGAACLALDSWLMALEINMFLKSSQPTSPFSNLIIFTMFQSGNMVRITHETC